MNMKTLIINGSPRKNGDTAYLIRLLSEKLSGDIKTVNTYSADISPCIDCRACKKTGVCAIEDGMQEIYEYIKECDNILIASPIYFSELTGKLLDFGSRLQAFYCAKRFAFKTPISKPKRGGIILVGGGDGSPEKAQSTAVTLLHKMNAFDIFGAVTSLNTETIPAKDDEKAAADICALSEFFCGNK